MATSAPPFRVNSNANILNNLNIGRHRPRGSDRGGGRRDRNRTTTPAPDHDHDHDVTTKAASRDQEGSSSDRGNTVSNTETGLEEIPPATRDGDGGFDPHADGDHVREDGDDHDHNTGHDEFTCEPASSQHSSYIRNNLELLKKKCDEFHACTVELYQAENFHRVLAGENIQLKNICGLMYANGGGQYTTLNDQCSVSERAGIRQNIGTRLTTTLANPPQDSTKNSWEKLNRCLADSGRPGEQRITTACRLKRNSTFLCDDHNVDHVTEEFFNHEMEHLHCSCQAIEAMDENINTGSSSLSASVRIGVASGVVGLLVILIIVVIVLCMRHRKVKRKLSQHRMQYLPSPHGEPSAIYQEIGEQPYGLEALRRARDQGNLPSHYNCMDQAPALPDRYVKDISKSRSNLATTSDGSPEYLEPIADPDMIKRPQLAHDNNAYNVSQSSRHGEEHTYDLAKVPSTDSSSAVRTPENTYFDRVNMSRNNKDEDGGYSSLGRGNASKGRGGPAEANSCEETEPLTAQPEEEESTSPDHEEPKYFVLEPQT